MSAWVPLGGSLESPWGPCGDPLGLQGPITGSGGSPMEARAGRELVLRVLGGIKEGITNKDEEHETSITPQAVGQANLSVV